MFNWESDNYHPITLDASMRPVQGMPELHPANLVPMPQPLLRSPCQQHGNSYRVGHLAEYSRLQAVSSAHSGARMSPRANYSTFGSAHGHSRTGAQGMAVISHHDVFGVAGYAEVRLAGLRFLCEHVVDQIVAVEVPLADLRLVGR